MIEQDLTEKVISAFENAVGINRPNVNLETGAMAYTSKEKDFTALQKLYGDPATKYLVEKMLEIGNIDKSVVGL